MRALTRKLFRDVARMKGQMLAVSLVMACGIAMLILSRSLILSLESTRDAYYERFAFADAFADLKRAPLAVRDRLKVVPGVAAVETRVTGRATLDLPGVAEPAEALLISLPEDRPQQLNRVCLRSGRLPEEGSRGEVLVGEAFADAHQFFPGAEVDAVLHGVRQRLRIVGTALSPEFVFEARPGETLPDNRRFGVFWMREGEVAAAFGLEGAFNSILLDVAPGCLMEGVLEGIDQILEPYGGLLAYARADHSSAQRLDDELRVVRGLSVAFPSVFLSIAAFMTSAVLTRLIRLQREQIAQLKAFGYSSGQVGLHYLQFALVLVVVGAVIGTLGGIGLGHQVVGVYHRFFRFPHLEFQLDGWGVLVAVLLSGVAALIGVGGAVRQAVRLPPAEAMRPEPPTDYRPSFLERWGMAGALTPAARMILRNIERRPWPAVFSVVGLALATAIPMVPGAMRDGIEYLLGFQWDRAQRQTVTVGFVEPSSGSALGSLQHLPGVLTVEPFRSVPARLGFGHQSRRLPVVGVPREAVLNRLLDAEGNPIALPMTGLVVSAKLAQRLGAVPGDTVQVRVLEGKRPEFDVVIGAVLTDYAGVSAYMEIEELQKLMGEGAAVNGAHLAVDALNWGPFLREVRAAPRVASMVIKEAVRGSFRRSTGEMIGMIQTLYFGFSVVVSFGVVYNGARIALSERSRELATLRVIGFTHGEVAAVMVGEIAVLTLAAIPFGLWLGSGMAAAIVSTASTETVRLPLILTLRAYCTSTLIVVGAAAVSGAVVARRIRTLDLLAVLKSAE